MATLCVALGLGVACPLQQAPRPPAVRPPAVAAPVVRGLPGPAPQVPRLHGGTRFPPSCPSQPPRAYRADFLSAARRYPAGATACELARQAEAESSFRADAYNEQSGAIGISQFLPATAAELGIDPWDARQSIFGQARYVLWCRGAWTPGIGGRKSADIAALGLGCYNWGRGAMFRNQKRHGWVLYQDADPRLPEETRGYVRKIMGEEWRHDIVGESRPGIDSPGAVGDGGTVD